MEELLTQLETELQQQRQDDCAIQRCLQCVQEIRELLRLEKHDAADDDDEFEVRSEKHANAVIRRFLPYMLLYSLQLQDDVGDDDDDDDSSSAAV